jgi:hypothetical protein
VSNTGTTSDDRPSRTLNCSIAASRRWYGTGLRLVFSWLAEVTGHTIVASENDRSTDAWNRVSTWWRPGKSR